jgi:hypothetical protein
VLPSTLTGELGSADPKVRALHTQLKDLDRRIENNILDIPPEGQRSPSPEPVYDRMGVRLNTREIRAKEKLLDQRLSESMLGCPMGGHADEPGNCATTHIVQAWTCQREHCLAAHLRKGRSCTVHIRPSCMHLQR